MLRIAILAWCCVTAGALAQDAAYEYIREGNAADVAPETRPGYMLAGGGKDVEPAFRWMIDRSGNGDFLVLRASGTAAYNSFVRQCGNVNSAATLILRTREASYDPAVLERIRTAEAIFFAGGDQWNYVSRWKGTPLHEAVQERINAGVPVGGTSAGLAILGEFLFSAEHDGITSAEALADPFHLKVTIATGFFKIPGLENLMTDSHFSERNRMGRLLVFLSRMSSDQPSKPARGLGIDERTAVLLDRNGLAKVTGSGRAYFVTTTRVPESCAPGKPLSIRGVTSYAIGESGSFDLRSWRGTRGAASQLSVHNGQVTQSAIQ